MQIAFIDDPSPGTIFQPARKSPVVFTLRRPTKSRHIHCFQLTPWCRDDIVEYLLATRPERCCSVMSRLEAANDNHLFAGVPELWRVVLDQMITDDSAETVTGRTTRRLIRHVGRRRIQTAAEQYSFAEIAQRNFEINDCFNDLQRLQPDKRLVSLLRHTCVRVLLASGYLAWLLEGDRGNRYLKEQIAYSFLSCTAKELAPKGINHLQEMLANGPKRCHPMAASFLHAANAPWMFPSHKRANLAGAYLSCKKLDRANLEQAELQGADFSRCEMNSANLAFAKADGADFSHTCLDFAQMPSFQAKKANFAHAVLAHADCTSARFQKSLFRHANFSAAPLTPRWLRIG